MVSHLIMSMPIALEIGITGVKLGLIFCILTLGVHIAFRILDIADLSIEGVFPLGGCVTAILVYFNVPAILAILGGVVAGGIAGYITGILSTKLKIPAILSGIITMTGLFSINLAILGFSQKNSITAATLTIKNERTIFYGLTNLIAKIVPDLDLASTLSTLIICGIFAAVVFFAIYYFFGTELGMSIRATGDNEQMSRAQGIDTNKMKVLALVISNALIALAGALFALDQGRIDVTNGRGKIVVGLAAIVLGEIIFGRRSYKSQLISIIVGTVIYYILRSVAIEFNVDQFLDLISAILIVIILVIPLIKSKFSSKKKPVGGEQ